MYIVDQDRSNVVNIGNVKSIALSGKRITADDYTLAAYDTEQRGKEVFEQLLGNAFPPDMIVAKNCNISEDAVNDLAMDHSIIMVYEIRAIPKEERNGSERTGHSLRYVGVVRWFVCRRCHGNLPWQKCSGIPKPTKKHEQHRERTAGSKNDGCRQIRCLCRRT